MEKGRNTQSSILDDIPRLEARIAWREEADDSDMSEETRLIVAKYISAIAYRKIQLEHGIITEAEYQESVIANHEAIARIIDVEAAIAVEMLRRKIKRDGGI